jgi:hypothetical protein
MKLDFSCDGLVAGQFIDMTSYPKAPGRYAYMPYRGPGHLRLQDECRRSGFARCTYVEPTGQVSFRARAVGEYGVLDVDEIGDPL